MHDADNELNRGVSTVLLFFSSLVQSKQQPTIQQQEMSTYTKAYYLKEDEKACPTGTRRSRKHKGRCNPICPKGERYNWSKDLCLPKGSVLSKEVGWTKLPNGTWRKMRSPQKRCPPHSRRVFNSKGEKKWFCDSPKQIVYRKLKDGSGRYKYRKQGSKRCRPDYKKSPSGKWCVQKGKKGSKGPRYPQNTHIRFTD
jgi:hypothetical protein